MSSESALASLTANYTDSEDSDELEINAPVGDLSVSAPSSAPSSPSPKPEFEDDEEEKNKVELSKPDPRAGLVSYSHDENDMIDDDAVDDYSSDTPREAGSESTRGISRDDITDVSLPDYPVEEDMQSDERMDEDDDKAVSENVEDQESLRRVREGPYSWRKKLPPEPSGKASESLQKQIARLYERKIKGTLDMNQYIQNNKNFRNPSIYEKLIKHCGIDELGTNYPKEIYDPHEWPETSYHDELTKAQKTEMERREKERKDKTKVEFVSGTAKKAGYSDSDSTKRKSKWDQRGTSLIAPVANPTAHAQITSNVTGTRGTVINAFGSLPKRKF